MKATRFALQSKVVPLKPQKPFLLHDAGRTNLPPLPETVEVSKQQALSWFKLMTTIRRMESLCDQSYKAKKIRGFCHLYIGQEAIVAGMSSVLNFEDSIVTGYRDHGWHIARGGTCREVFAEMFGKQTGCSKGKGGSMHMYKTANNFYGGNGIVGAQVPIGVGLAWKHSYENPEKPSNVSVALYGDGAANQGQIFEVFNMAALYKIPCIFCVENNQFGMGTSKKRASADPEFYHRGAYIPGLKVDGMDVLAVQEATRWAKNWCTSGNGPIVLEMDSYRYMGHSMSDPDSAYRQRSDIQTVRNERDCINKLRNLILETALATEDELKAIEKEVRVEVDKELALADADEITKPEELTTDIYSNNEKFPVRSCQGTVFL